LLPLSLPMILGDNWVKMILKTVGEETHG